MSLQWREQLSVGNDLIDDDHKHLVRIVNQAEEALTARNMNQLKTVLASLADYAKYHFLREESVASAVAYPRVPQMHDSHEALITKLKQVTQELDQDLSEISGQNFIDFLRDWLISHVIKEDLQMKPFLEKFSPKFDPRQ